MRARGIKLKGGGRQAGNAWPCAAYAHNLNHGGQVQKEAPQTQR